LLQVVHQALRKAEAVELVVIALAHNQLLQALATHGLLGLAERL